MKKVDWKLISGCDLCMYQCKQTYVDVSLLDSLTEDQLISHIWTLLISTLLQGIVLCSQLYYQILTVSLWILRRLRRQAPIVRAGLYPVVMFVETEWEGASWAFTNLHLFPSSLTTAFKSSSRFVCRPPHITSAKGWLHRPTSNAAAAAALFNLITCLVTYTPHPTNHRQMQKYEKKNTARCTLRLCPNLYIFYQNSVRYELKTTPLKIHCNWKGQVGKCENARWKREEWHIQ